MFFIKKLDSFIFIIFFTLIGYLFINSDYRIIFYDSEPDYIANALTILKNGFPLNAHHPGTLTYYIISFVLFFIINLSLSLTNSILIIRSIFYFLGLVILLKIKNIDRFSFIIAYSILFLVPEFRRIMHVISPEILLVPLSFFLCSLLKSNLKKNISIISVLFGLMLNLKLVSLILLPILFLKLLNNSHSDLLIKKFTFLTSISYLILILPVFSGFFIALKNVFVNIFPYWENIYQIIEYNNYSSNQKLLFLTLFSLIFFIIIYTLIQSSFIKFFLNKYKLDEFKYLILIFILIVFFIVIESNKIRHFIVLIPFISNELLVKIKLNENFKKFSLLIIFTLLISNISKPINYSNELDSDRYIMLSNSKIYFYQSSLSSSKFAFKKWANYRYSQSLNFLPSFWNERYLKKIEYLNTRNFKNENIVKTSFMNLSGLKPQSDASFNYNKCFSKQLYNLNIDNAKLLIFRSDEQEFKEDLNTILNKLSFKYKLIELEASESFKIFSLKIENYGSEIINCIN